MYLDIIIIIIIIIISKKEKDGEAGGEGLVKLCSTGMIRTNYRIKKEVI
jgi:hypothetical protein